MIYYFRIYGKFTSSNNVTFKNQNNKLYPKIKQHSNLDLLVAKQFSKN